MRDKHWNRPLSALTCVVCGRQFFRRFPSMYCTQKCNNRAWKERHAAPALLASIQGEQGAK